jgi:peptide/nickel transport system permease protein
VALFIVRRLLQAIVVLLLVTLISFALLRSIPGNVAAAVMGPNVYRDPAAIKLFDDTYGFNKPWYSQYLLWLSHLVQGNLGYSWNLNQSVASLLSQRILKTGILVGISLVLAVLIAVPIGMVQAVRRNKLIDHFFNGFSTIFYAMPSFLLGLVLIYIFAIEWPIFPAEAPQGLGLGVIFANFNAMILPVATLTLITIALFSRSARSPR